MLRYPDEVATVADKLAKIIPNGGLLLTRIYEPPSERETLDTVLTDLASAKIAELCILKTRLWMAMQRSPEEGIAVDDVWKAVDAFAPDLEQLERRIGWPEGSLCALDTYKGSRNRYHFFAVEELTSVFCAGGGFTLERVCYPTYELGDWCPTVVLRRTED
jgi:hypothetical protein